MGVSVCIDVQVKDMQTRASWSGTDGVEQRLWYGEASHMLSERSLLFWTFKIIALDVEIPRDVTSVKCFSLMRFPFSLNIRCIFYSMITRRAHSAFLTPNFLQANGIHVLGLASPLLRSRSHRSSLGRVGETYPHPTKTALRTTTNSKPLNVKNGTTLPQTFINRLVNSMRRRCTAVVNADGSHNRF